MGKFISNLFLGALAVALSIFTASRTLDLLAWALPSGQIIYQWLGLAAYEGGMYFWSFYFVSGAKGVQQRSIALIMAVFSVLAVCIATIVDLSLGAAESGKIAPLTPDMQQAMIVFVGITIALNVAAFLACKLMSPEKLREIASGQAEDLIYAEGLRAISSLAPSIAADAAPHLATEWANRTWQNIVPGVPHRTEYLGPASAPVPALPAGAPEPLPLQSPTRPPAQGPAPVTGPVVPSQAPAKKPGMFSKAKDFLWSGSNSKEVVTLAQTGTVQAPTPAPASAPAPASQRQFRASTAMQRHLRTRQPSAAVSVVASRRARRAARLGGAPHRNWGAQAFPDPGPVASTAAAPDPQPAPAPEPAAAPAPEQKARKPRPKK